MKLVILGAKGSVLFGRTWKPKKASICLDVLKSFSYEVIFNSYRHYFYSDLENCKTQYITNKFA